VSLGRVREVAYAVANRNGAKTRVPRHVLPAQRGGSNRNGGAYVRVRAQQQARYALVCRPEWMRWHCRQPRAM